MAKHATIRLQGLKIMQPIPAELVPVDLVPPDGPAGNPSITLELEGFGPGGLPVLEGAGISAVPRSPAAPAEGGGA